ncbi:MAG: hypothetical protein K8E66_10415, partial [Phycisphaerales bacterium]|nr:hypothetical protein [Phycisphaerales bacterium]
MTEEPLNNDEHEAATLIGWLAGRDEACPVCGHNLRDTRGVLCAECGSPLSLSVTSSRLRPGPWLLAFGSFVLALGFDAVTTLLLMIPLVMMTRQQGTLPPLPFWAMLGMMVALAALTAGGVWVLLEKRSAWHRMTPAGQRWVAGGIFLGVGL